MSAEEELDLGLRERPDFFSGPLQALITLQDSLCLPLNECKWVWCKIWRPHAMRMHLSTVVIGTCVCLSARHNRKSLLQRPIWWWRVDFDEPRSWQNGLTTHHTDEIQFFSLRRLYFTSLVNSHFRRLSMCLHRFRSHAHSGESFPSHGVGAPVPFLQILSLQSKLMLWSYYQHLLCNWHK